MNLNDEMKDCLIEVDNKCPDASFEETVLEAVWLYELRHGPIEFVNEVEAEEFYKRCLAFVLDCTLLNMVRKGLCEVEGMDEDGELVYKATVEF